MKEVRRAFEYVFIISEILALICFAVFTENSPSDEDADAHVMKYYAMFQDVHVMIFVGFGFLMVYLKTHSWTSVGFNFLIAAWCLQITMLISPFWHGVVSGHFENIQLDVVSLIIGDFGAGAVLITFGAILGKCNVLQLWTIGTLEIIFYSLNEAVGVAKLEVVDLGGSMFIHTFGAYFGIAASFFFQPKKAIEDEKGRTGGGYVSKTVAMVGTLFLWMFWPSFNSVLGSGAQQQRAIVNTVLSISASCITACAVSRIVFQKLDMEVVLNATLAGGVAIGCACDMMTNAGATIAVGAISGIISAVGFIYLSPKLSEKFGLHDTCGVNNLHGMPGIMGGLVGAIATAAGPDEIQSIYSSGRSSGAQAGFQAAALGMTLVVALVTGAFSGWIASKVGHFPEEQFDDKEHWMHAEYDEETPLVHAGADKEFNKIEVLPKNAFVSEMTIDTATYKTKLHQAENDEANKVDDMLRGLEREVEEASIPSQIV